MRLYVPGSAMTPPDEPPPPRPARLADIFKAVLWSFFGVRKRARMQEDAVTIRPHQVIIAGVVVAALFVIGLLVVVRLVIRAAGA
jgi:hypothetical protein